MQDLGNEICDNIIENRKRNAKPQNENYFEIIIPRYTDVQFIEHFRMSQRTFEVCIFICIMHLYSINVILFLWNYMYRNS